MKFETILKNENDTKKFAKKIEEHKFKNMILCLNGDLGAGKTFFTKSLAELLGVNETVTSPTFTIIKEYNKGKLPLFHMDVYRLDGFYEGVGIEEYFEKDGIVIIEWAETIKEILPFERLDISINVLNETERKLILQPFGKKYEKLCEVII